ncbi:MAG: DUF4372 domain-containing protein, partial [Verrucomicrobiota bacterium]
MRKFKQLLGIFSRADFSAAVKRRGTERAAQGFDCWAQFMAMLFCQLGSRAVSVYFVVCSSAARVA